VSLENESGQRGVVDRLPFLAVAMRAMMKLEIPELGSRVARRSALSG
jgi:hypothetical protein